MSIRSGPKFRVAICGGGIGGITLAIALAEYADIEIDVYEAAAKFEELGAGLGIWGRGRTVLQRLGLEEKLAGFAGVPPNELNETSFLLRRADRRSGGPLGTFTISHTMGFPRARFLATLVSVLVDTGRARIHFKKRCVSFTQSENTDTPLRNAVVVQFADGTSAICDVLVGADGIKSAVRGELFRDTTGKDGSEQKPRRFAGVKFSGTVAYRALLKADDVRAIAGDHIALTRHMMYCGTNKHVVSYPVGGQFINILGYCSDPSKMSEWEEGPWEVESEPEELVEAFHDFEPEVQALLQCVKKTARWAMYEIEPLQFWSKGRVTLLGDAAHAMPPFIGAGGGQSIEDAFVLSHLLGSRHATRETLPSVLRAYEAVRLTRVNHAILSTREAGKIMEFRGGHEHTKNEDVASAVNKTAEWLWEGVGDPDEDVRQAESLIQIHGMPEGMEV